MNWIAILTGAGVVSGLGVLIGGFLGVFGRIFAVESDDRVREIREHLPGSNCGGCGFTGCDAMAQAIADGRAVPSGCAGCDAENRAAISLLMGIADTEPVRKVACVFCSGTCETVVQRYQYEGIGDCRRAILVPGGGSKACGYGCIGMGSCVAACPVGAIRVQDGCADVDGSLCIGCGACVRVCPRNLIHLLPASAPYVVRCDSKEKGKAVRENCATGCIGCGICAKKCPSGAISVQDNLARINPAVCTGCGVCASKCPAGIIRRQPSGVVAVVSSEEGEGQA